MPVYSHREKWRADDPVTVAVLPSGAAFPYAVDTSGAIAAMSRNEVPAVPLLLIQESDASDAMAKDDMVRDDTENALPDTRVAPTIPTDPCDEDPYAPGCPPPPPPPPPASLPVGVYVNEIVL
jgi:hypothetical protein